MKASEVREIIDKHSGERGELIAILEDIQSKYSYLPEAALREIAERTGRLLVDIYGVATFYKWFSLEPRGKHVLSCCLGTACHVRGAPKVAEEFERHLGVKPGSTTPDREFTLETVNCLGACALGPIVVADGHYFSNVTPNRVKSIIARTGEGLDRVDIEKDQRVFPVEVNCSRCNRSLMDTNHLVDGVPSIKVTVASGQTHGWLRLSSLYGSYNLESEHEIPMGGVAGFFCPHCHAGLRSASTCVECGAPMIPLIVRAGGMLQICSRRGCRSRRLDLDGTNL